jgi:zinc transport system substrate-binding protein
MNSVIRRIIEGEVMSVVRRAAVVAGVVLGGLIGVVALQGCSAGIDPWKDKPGVRVVVSFPPLYSFVKEVGGDDVSVICLLTKDGPHDYDFSPKDVIPLRGADLFFVNGLNLDEFATSLRKSADNPKLKTVALAEKAIPKEQWRPVSKEEEEAHGHSHGAYDPHVWLGTPEAVLMVKEIAKQLAETDPDHAAAYQKRADAYVDRLHALHTYGRTQFEKKKDRGFVSFHESLAYFARAFGLELVGSIQARANVEPNPFEIKNLVDRCKAKNVRVITVEPQYPSDTAARTLVRELKNKGMPDVTEVEIDPLETADPADLDAGWYERKMKKNIDTLAEALR